MQGVIGEIRGFGGNFAPRTWALCKGQLVAISQNTALFSIIGTTYGGDGRTTFALPDLRGRIPLSEGRGPGLSPRPLGQRSGTEDVTLNVLQIPSHFHFATAGSGAAPATFTATSSSVAAATAADSDDPTGRYFAKTLDSSGNPVLMYGNPSTGDMNAGTFDVTQHVGVYGIPAPTISPTGGGQEHNNMMPYLTINWIICQEGIYPSRS